MAIPEVQIAFQGGGAKFISMLPVADAFQYCEGKGRIKIKALAGTSAGAICAALIAADCDFARLRTYLRVKGREHLDNLFGANAQKLAAVSSSTGIARIHKLLSARSALGAVLKDGEPVLHEAEFGEFLKGVLSCCSRGEDPIQSLSRKLAVIATDLAKAGGEEIRSGSLETALGASCGLPIALRSFQHLSLSHLVDGGLCDNLPVNCLRTDPGAPIFAVFPEGTADRAPANDIFSYMLSLFSAAIDHNVNVAKSMVSPAFHFPVKTNFSTFDFDKALDLLDDDDWYERTKQEAVSRITNFSKSYGTIGPASQYRFDDTKSVEDYASALENVTRDYASHFEHHCSQLIVQVHSTDAIGVDDAGISREADSTIRRFKIRVKSDQFRYFRSSVASADADEVPSIWTAFNVTKNSSLPIKVLSLEKNVGTAAAEKHCLVEFLDPEIHISNGDEIHISETSFTTGKSTMIELNRGRLDFMSISNQAPYAQKEVEIVLVYPAVLGKFAIEPNAAKSKPAPSKYEKIAADTDYVGIGTVTIGAKAYDLPPGGMFYCDIIPQPI